MTSPQHERLLAFTAQRARARPEYLAWVLARYVEIERISEEKLLRRLGIAASDLPHLALCLRPRAEHFAEDIKQISGRFKIAPSALATVVRLVESAEALASRNAAQGPTDAGLLMAARERKLPPAADVPERDEHDHPGP
jgi:hypothetical protein